MQEQSSKGRGDRVVRRLLPALIVFVLVVAGGCGEKDSGPKSPSPPEPVPIPLLATSDPVVVRQLDEARQELDSLTAKDPDSAALAEAFGKMGQLYHAYDLLEPAAACYRNALRLSPETARWHYYLGTLQQRAGRFDEAATILGRAAELEPDSAPVLERLGRVELSRNHLPAARDRFSRASEVDPGCASAVFGLGQVAQIDGDLATAADRFAQTLELQPAAFQVHYSLAQVLGRLGRQKEAEEHLRLIAARPVHVGGRPGCPNRLDGELASLATGVAVHLARGLRAGRGGAFGMQIEEFQRAVELGPQDPVARHALGVTHLRREELEEAQVELGRAVELDPESADYRYDLAQTHFRLGSIDEAQAQLEAAIRLRPLFDKARLKLAEIHLLRGRVADAASEARRALELDPTLRQASVVLTMALLRAGRSDEALVEVKKLLDDNPPPDPKERLMFAGLLVPLGDPEGAAERLAVVVELDAEPSVRARAYATLGQVQLSLGRDEAARASFARALELDPSLGEARQGLERARR